MSDTPFHGPNAGYVLDLYERYQRDPASVDAATRAFFERWTPSDDDGGPGSGFRVPGRAEREAEASGQAMGAGRGRDGHAVGGAAG